MEPSAETTGYEAERDAPEGTLAAIGPKLVRIERMLLDTQVHIGELIARVDSLQTSFELAVTQQLEREEEAATVNLWRRFLP